MIKPITKQYVLDEYKEMPLDKYKVDFSFYKSIGKVVGVATLEISGKKLAAIEYGSDTVNVVRVLIEKLKVQVIRSSVSESHFSVYC
jgi:hypothetical protein